VKGPTEAEPPKNNTPPSKATKPHPKPKNQGKGNKNPKKVTEPGAEWIPFCQRLEALKTHTTPQIAEFQQIQDEILAKLEANPSQEKECSAKLCVPVQKTDLYFKEQYSCPGTGSAALFSKFGMKSLKPKQPISLEKQIASITTLDRNLGFQRDHRCEGFRPTELQKRILDKIDSGRSFLVRSPASSGKTMVSLYLILKTLYLHPDKKAIYVGPNKPVCNEFSLFTTNLKNMKSDRKTQILKFAIGTEDFFSWKEMLDSQIMICTPAIFWQMIQFPPEGVDMTKLISAVIFDEFPSCFRNFRETRSLLFLCASLKLQTMLLSATFSADEISLLRSIFPIEEDDIIEPKDAIKPVDTFMFKYHAESNTLEPLTTRSTYSPSLVAAPPEERTPRALRVPISLKEFKETASSKSAPSDLSTLLPTTRCFNGVDVTNFCLSCTTPAPILEAPLPKPGATPTPLGFPSVQQIYKMIRTLETKNMLPVMFFLDNPKQLDEYHRGVTKLVLESLETGKQLNERHTNKKLVDEDESINKGTKINSLGGMDDVDLASIFKHYSDHSGAEGKAKIKFGMRGNLVKSSQEYAGIEVGLGVHHHAIHKSVRDAVESGLRMEHLKVVFCDYQMALGLNMPVKTVVFIGTELELAPADFVQAAGRAGRWGSDTDGSIVFINFSDEKIRSIWDPISAPPPTFPLTPSLTLSLLASHPSVRATVPQWAEFNINHWGWNKGTCCQYFNNQTKMMQSLGLLEPGLQLTHAGKCGLSLVCEENVALFAGFCMTDAKLKSLIQTKRDFLYVVSHFVRRWRTEFEGPKLTDVVVTKGLESSMQEIWSQAKSIFESHHDDGSRHIAPPSEITALYTMACLNGFSHLSQSDIKSYLSHFLHKIEPFQRVARLPCGDEAIEELKMFIFPPIYTGGLIPLASKKHKI